MAGPARRPRARCTLDAMAAIDPNRHPLLHEVAQGAQWVGTDDFPSFLAWADEHEAWLRFVKDTGGLAHYLPRLRGPKERRDEAFAEIAVAYFFARKCGMSVLDLEPLGANGKRGEFLIGFDRRQPVFVEVKSPGWEDEIAKAEGQTSDRLELPKYIHAEARSTAPWACVRHAVKKAYPKMPDTIPTLLVVNDDLMVSLADWGEFVTDIGLYTPRHPGHTSGYLAEDGPFVDGRCERLGAVGVFKVDLPSEGIRYRFALFENPHALPSVAIPPQFAEGHPRSKGELPEPRSIGGEPWFAEILKDEEWVRGETEKARKVAQEVIDELNEGREDRPPA